MRILLVSSTREEIKPFLDVDITNETEVLITGVGIPSAVYHLTKRLSSEEYDMVIQAGIAGSFSKKIKRGKVVVVRQDCFADVGVEENGKLKTVFEMGLAGENDFPFEDGLLVNNHTLLQIIGLDVVNAVTVNKISDCKKANRLARKKFNAHIETMEGAALHYTCLHLGIPFLQLRAISNYIGVRNKSKWRIEEAVLNLNTELARIFKTLPNHPGKET